MRIALVRVRAHRQQGLHALRMAVLQSHDQWEGASLRIALVRVRSHRTRGRPAGAASPFTRTTGRCEPWARLRN